MVKIMVVDDAAFMRLVLKQILSENGLQVVAEAKDGKEALRLFKQTRPDVVIMDINMPEMDDIDAMKEIRKVDPQANVIMCSAMGQYKKILDAMKAGASDFIEKPFQRERVFEAIVKVAQLYSSFLGHHCLRSRTGRGIFRFRSRPVSHKLRNDWRYPFGKGMQN